MNYLIEKILEEYAHAQVNLSSKSARETLAKTIVAAIKSQDDLGVDEFPYEDAGDGHLLKVEEYSDEIYNGHKNKLSEEIVGEGLGYIFESPDGGKTIYKRKVGESKKELVSREFWKEYTRNR
tara:strand:- start:95 stop:463 length:369 start_codon:yes stop_codon:yes gene_type:complete